MGQPTKPEYNFSDPIFQKNFLYRRLAKEHISLSQLESDSIHIEVKQTRGSQQVPEEYDIHYYLNSIVGVRDNGEPIYGNHHIARVTLPPKYPLEPAKVYMVTEAWHPNIKSDGKFKGRICSNSRDFGKGYELYQLVLRIGEILQYKNYHATHTPPYPEDAKVAQWVLEYAEPHDIVNKHKGIFTDNKPLVKSQIVESLSNQPKEEPEEMEAVIEHPVDTTPEMTMPPSPEQTPQEPEEKMEEEKTDSKESMKIKIGSSRKPTKPTGIKVHKK